MAASSSDLLTRVTDSTTGRPVVSTLASPGKAVGAASITLSDATNWSTTTKLHVSIYNVTASGYKDPTTQTDWIGILAGTTFTFISTIPTGGTDRSYTAGAIVEVTPTSRYAKDLYEWGISHANTDGSLKATAVQTALNLGSSSLNGWNPLGYTFDQVTYLGNRSYSCRVPGQDVTGTLSAGMRLRTTKTVAAPTQSTSLNGTTQYWSKTSPAGMTFTNNFVVSAWVKLNSYGTNGFDVASRYDATNGWRFYITSSGQVELLGYNASSANSSFVNSYQSIPLNKWVHITAQLDMATFTATPTTSYVMIDGVDVPSSVGRSGTNPTALVQPAGPLQIGVSNSGGSSSYLNGKIAQVAIFSAKVTQATMQSYYSQGLAGTETSLISAYSFNGNANDLNSTNANNLTANGAATATAADSPFGGQAGGTISSTLDYGIVQSATFSTNTTVVVQVPEGCTITTSGGISAVAYSSVKAPYGMPVQRGKWTIDSIYLASFGSALAASWGQFSSIQVTLPIGEWRGGYQGDFVYTWNAAGGQSYIGLSASSSSLDDVTTQTSHQCIVANNGHFMSTSRVKSFSLSSQTIYYLVRNTNASATSLSTNSNTVLYAENTYL